jgi:flavorubredoxin
MKVLIVYDSVSQSKVTKQVAEIIGEALKEKGIEVDTRYFEEVDKAAVTGYDCMIAGAPTMAFHMSKGMGLFLDGLKGIDFKGKQGTGFGTQIARFSGNAAKGIQNKLEDLGFTTFKPHLVVYVESGKEKGTWQFKPGELEKTKAWAQEAISALS